MEVEDIRAVALKLKGSTEDIKWEDHLCFSVGGKMYLVTNPDQVPSSAAFKVPEEDFEDILSKKGFQKHPYLGRHYWISLDDINRLSLKQWEKYIKQSYLLVAAKLSKKTQKELGLI